MRQGRSPSAARETIPNAAVSKVRTPQVPPSASSGADPRPPPSVQSFAPSRADREEDRLSDHRSPVLTYGSQGYTPPLKRMPSARERLAASPIEELPPPVQDLAEGTIPTTSDHKSQTDQRNTYVYGLGRVPRIRVHSFIVSFAECQHLSRGKTRLHLRWRSCHRLCRTLETIGRSGRWVRMICLSAV